MATTDKMEPTKYPGVFRLENGQFVVQVGVKLAGAQKKARKVLPAGTTIAAAVAQGEAMKEALRHPPAPTPSPRLSDTGQTFEVYATRWAALRSKRLKPAAKRTYLAALEGKIVPRLGWLQCQDVTREAIESWVGWAEGLRMPTGKPSGTKGEKKPQGDVVGKPYSHDSMRQWWRILRTICRDMAADLNLPDATARVRAPERLDQDPVREQRTLDEDALGKLLDAAATLCPDRAAEVAVMALTGMRAGEVYGLKWECVDFAAGTVVVRRAVSEGQLMETTKTKARRVVPLHPVLAEILQAHRTKLVAGQHPGLSTGLVFPSDEGGIRLPSSLQKVWPDLRAQLKTDVRVGPQVLRRSLNTNLVLAGVDRITLRSIMGHTSEAMTARYAHASLDVKTAAVGGLRVVPSAPAEGEAG